MGGTPYAFLLPRSVDFLNYLAVARLQLYDTRDIQIYINLMQQVWDQGEGAGWLMEMNQNNKTTPKQVLIQGSAFECFPINLHVSQWE
ncbi:MAG: hypothetical protein ACK4UN_17135 [Limisphaerales bacterium]